MSSNVPVNASVIMAVYNAEPYLPEAIESILDQTFQDFELILIDDGSTDKSHEIMCYYNDDRINIICKENSGAAAARNTGIEVAKGKYIAILDADDIALENRLQLQYEFMETHPDIDILGGQALIINEDGNIIGEMQKPISRANILKYIKYACPLCNPTSFFRRHVYEITKGYRNIPPGEDYDFFLRAFDKNCILANIPDKIIKYRRITSTASSRNPQRTVIFTSQIQKMHKMRIRGKKAEEEKILAVLQNYDKKTTFWFGFIYKRRNKLMKIQKKQKGIKKILFTLLIIFVSLGNYNIFLNTYHGSESLKWNK